MKSIIYIILFIFPIIAICQNEWDIRYMVNGQHPQAIEVLDSNYVNIFMSTGSNFKYIINSRNQGKDWNLLYSTNLYLHEFNMSCPDTNTFYLSYTKGIIYKLLNQGKDVEIINIDTNHMYEIRNLCMLNKDTGLAINNSIIVTKDGWNTYKYKDYFRINDSISYSFGLPHFKNDSIVTCLVGNSRGANRGSYFCEFNINTFEYKLYSRGNNTSSSDMAIIDKKHIFICGKTNTLNGGSGNDAIYKSNDSGKTWRRVLDLYTDNTKFPSFESNPFGLQSISFKDSLTGIAVGQFGKIVYTYDGGETWIYENKLHEYMHQPNTMKIRYAGSVPIISTFLGHIYRMIEDNLAPKPEDTLTISGRVWEGTKGQSGIPIVLGYRVTMTDSNGYYKFTRLPKGKHIIKAENKYHDGKHAEYYYKPFDYTPEQYELDLTADTSGIDFNAIDLRTFYRVSGYILTDDGVGLKNIPITVGDSSTVSGEDGKFVFPKIESNRTFDLLPFSYEYSFSPWVYSINIQTDLDTFRFIAKPKTSVVEEIQKSELLLSPNPATDILTIQINSNSINCYNKEIEIYDILGLLITKKVLSCDLTEGIHIQIDISYLQTGVYYIKIGDTIKKFIKL